MRMSLHHLWSKIKHIPRDTQYNLFVVGVIITVAVGSFALGRLSVEQPTFEPSFVYPDEIVRRAERVVAGESQQVVASTRGSKYHYPWCPGAISMSPENKITFDSIEAAQNAGYEPATNCDGLN